MATACNSMKKKNQLLLIIILTAALLIAIVFWIYAKRIERIDNKIIHSRQSAHFVSAPANPRNFEIM
jgi:CHASE3 domain sensor protein